MLYLKIGIESWTSNASHARRVGTQIRRTHLAESDDLLSYRLSSLTVVPELAEPPVLGNQSHRRRRRRVSGSGGVASNLRGGVGLLGEELSESSEGMRAQSWRIVIVVVLDVVGSGIQLVFHFTLQWRKLKPATNSVWGNLTGTGRFCCFQI